MGLLTACSSIRSYFLVSSHRLQAVLNISDFLFFSAYFSLYPHKTCGWITWLSADTGEAVQNTVWCIARRPLLGANCSSWDRPMLVAVWKPASKGRPVSEQGLLPLTRPVDCIAHKFISTAVPSLSLSSGYAVWARTAWKSAGFWLGLLPKLTLSKFCPVFSRIYLHREWKSSHWFILCWLSLNYLANSWILNTETFFLSYYFYS